MIGLNNLTPALRAQIVMASYGLAINPNAKVRYAQSTHAAAGNTDKDGTNPTNPFASIDYAVGLCTANVGDVIVALPGHVETIAAAGGLDLDVAGITVIGIGSGTLQPQIKVGGATTADIDIDAANITVFGMNIVANYADVAVLFDVNADDFSVLNCRFTQAAVDLNALICVQDAAAGGSDRIRIEGCHAIMYDAANTHFVNFAGTGDGHIVRGNTLHGDWGTMAVGGAGVVTFATITDNVIANAASTSDACINFAATATGIVMRNLCSGAAAQANGITATAMAIAENYYGVISEDLSAILDPIAT